MENTKTTNLSTGMNDSSKRVGNAPKNREEAAPPAAAAPQPDQTRDASSTNRDSEEAVGPDDVLLGRGGATNSHSGNRKFRNIVAEHQQEYLKARKREKVGIARRIVAIVHNNGGRFLKRTDNAQNWIEVTEKRAQEKTSQALREGLDVRNNTIRPSKMIKEVRPSAQAAGDKPAGKVVKINIPQFSPNSTVSHPVYYPHQQQYAQSSGGGPLLVPELKHNVGNPSILSSSSSSQLKPVFLPYQPPSAIPQKDVKDSYEV